MVHSVTTKNRETRAGHFSQLGLFQSARPGRKQLRGRGGLAESWRDPQGIPSHTWKREEQGQVLQSPEGKTSLGNVRGENSPA